MKAPTEADPRAAMPCVPRRDDSQNRLRHGIFRDVEELVPPIGEYTDQHNDHPKPFVWTARATGILEKVSGTQDA